MQDNITTDIDTDSTPAPEDGIITAPATDNTPTPEPADDFTISDTDADAPTPGSEKDDEPQGEQKPEKEEAPYVVELPEDFETTDAFRDILTAEGKAAGIDSKTWSKAVAGVINKVRAADAAEQKKAAEQLRSDWGAEYQDRMKNTRQFAAELVRKGVISRQMADGMQNPFGFRVFDAWRQSRGEDSFTRGSSTKTSWGNPAEEAHAMVTNPDHPDYAALDDRDHPRHEAARHKYERLCGVRK